MFDQLKYVFFGADVYLFVVALDIVSVELHPPSFEFLSEHYVEEFGADGEELEASCVLPFVEPDVYFDGLVFDGDEALEKNISSAYIGVRINLPQFIEKTTYVCLFGVLDDAIEVSCGDVFSFYGPEDFAR